MMPDNYFDIFLSHNTEDKPFARALCRVLQEQGCTVFFDDDDMHNEEIAGSKIDEVFDKTLVFAGCWGEHGVGSYQKFELDIAFNFAVHKELSLATVILPGATSKDPSARFRGFPPIVFTEMKDTAPVEKLLRVVDRARAERGLPSRKTASGAEERLGADTAIAPKPQARAQDGEEDPRAVVIEQLRRDARQFGLNFLVGPLTGIEAPTGEDFGEEQNLPFPESGEPSPWELAQLLSAKDINLPMGADKSSHRIPLELVASWLSMGRGGPRQVQSHLQSILQVRRHGNSRFYDRLARVIRLLLDSRELTRRRRTPPPMIFTTNLGTHLEWQMIRHGVPFTRITVKLPDRLEIQSVSSVIEGDSIVLSDLYDEDAQPIILPVDDEESEARALGFLADALPKTVGRPGSEMSRNFRGGDNEYDRPETSRGLSFDDVDGCVLFKYHGSIDVDDSCVVNNEQLFELTRIEDLVPAAVEERLKISPTVVFGTSFLLTGVQQVAEAVLRGPLTSTRINRYVVPRENPDLKDRSQDGWLMQLEEKMCDDLKHRASTLNLVQVAPGQQTFLKALEENLEHVLATSMQRSA